MMDFLYAEINIVGIVLLMLFLNNMNRNKYRNKSIDQDIFNACMIMNILIFIFDTGMWMVDGKDLEIYRTINYIVTLLYYIANPLICLFWLMYTDYKIYENRNDLIKRLRFYVVPWVISAVLSLFSVYSGWLFVIDERNVYARGPYFWIMAIVALFYLILSFILALKDVIKNGWEDNKNVYIHLVIFPVGIIFASIIQIMFFGISIIWISTMIAFASIYINIQNGEIWTDHLTGLNNRRRLDEHYQRRQKMHRNGKLLFVIMLDLDDFKKINDEFGHLEGDAVLIQTANLLRQACTSNDDFIARMGGDEFAILGERSHVDAILDLMKNISLAIAEFNTNHKMGYDLRLSMGYSIYTKEDSINSFFAAADQAMYKNKHERKLIQY